MGEVRKREGGKGRERGRGEGGCLMGEGVVVGDEDVYLYGH